MTVVLNLFFFVLLQASPENSRNASPRYHDASMEDVSRETAAVLTLCYMYILGIIGREFSKIIYTILIILLLPQKLLDLNDMLTDCALVMFQASEAGALFRVTSAGGGKNELVARGGSGGALALSRAPVGGSASPAPAPLPQPAPSPAPAALPPPAPLPPPFRADTPHRNNGAHIPTLESHAAATQVPRPVAGPDTPERPASNNKLQPGARAAADSPTPAPPAPPAPSPLFPSHTAYQAHAADYRHTNHEARTEPAPPEPLAAPAAATATATAAAPQPPAPLAPLDLHATRPPHPTSLPGRGSHPPLIAPHPVVPGHDGRVAPVSSHSSVPAPFSTRVAGAPAGPAPSIGALPTSLPSQSLPGRPASPAGPVSRSYPTPTIGSSHHINSSLSSSIPNHALAYHSQSSLQKHSVQSVYASRPSHLTPFSVANHISSHHIQASLANQPTATHLGHPINSHSIMNHTSHLPMHTSNSLPMSSPNHIGLPFSTAPATIPNYTPSIKHPGLSLPPHSIPLVPPVSLHASVNHIDSLPTSTAPAVVTSVASSGNVPLAPSVVDSRQPSVMDSKQSSILDSRQPPVIDSRQPPLLDSSRQPPVVIDSRQAQSVDSRHQAVNDPPARSEAPTVSSLATNGYPPPAVYSGPPYPPLYAPYATTLQHSPYLPAAAASPRNATDTVSFI